VRPQAEPQDDLITRFVSGDRGAFAEVAREHGAAVHRLTRAVARDDALAADAAQEALLAAFRGAASYRPELGPLRPWLLAIARREAYRLRDGTADARDLSDDESLVTLGVRAGWSADDPEATLARAEDRERLSWALASLPANDREVLWLRDVEGLSGEETSAIVGVELAAMKSRLHRARLKLMATLREGDTAVSEQERHEGGLSCSEVLAKLSDYVDGHLERPAKAAVDAHLTACSVCERFGGRFRRTVAGVRSRLGVDSAVDEATYRALLARFQGLQGRDEAE
jgi:RNA polymerase sigma-70 factor (ECF subfamily)